VVSVTKPCGMRRGGIIYSRNAMDERSNLRSPIAAADIKNSCYNNYKIPLSVSAFQNLKSAKTGAGWGY